MQHIQFDISYTYPVSNKCIDYPKSVKALLGWTKFSCTGLLTENAWNKFKSVQCLPRNVFLCKMKHIKTR